MWLCSHSIAGSAWGQDESRTRICSSPGLSAALALWNCTLDTAQSTAMVRPPTTCPLMHSFSITLYACISDISNNIIILVDSHEVL